MACLLTWVWLLGAATTSWAQVDAEAVPGTPFGVGRVTVRLANGSLSGLSGVDAIPITEKNGRLLYPVRGSGLLSRILGERNDDPQRLAVWFLFRGDGPLEITFGGPTPTTATITPRGRPRQHDRLLDQWWRRYNAAAQHAADSDTHPSIVDYYLVAMLSRRLNRPPTLAGRKLFDNGDAERGLGLLLGTQSLRVALASELMLARGAPPEGPLAPVESPPLVTMPAPPAEEKLDMEPLAGRVPAECFYVRFGSFANYRWLQGLTSEFGGDLANLIAPQGLNYNLNGRLEQRLALRETTLGTLLGSQVIDDMALIGADTFFREGPAVGMLFKAKSNLLLANGIRQQRTATLGENKLARETTVKLAGHDVSLVATPDFSVRSFYAVRGDYHLVTTSQTIARRFLELPDEASLGRSAGFRHARTILPTSRGDTVFMYLSDTFWQQLATPQYRIEMARRLRSLTEIELWQLARKTAAAEGVRDASVAELQRLGLLPAGFNERRDGSRLEISPERVAFDSLRGGRGSFLPVPDVEVPTATASELAEYREFRRVLEQHVGAMQPMMLALRREPTDQPDVERIVLDGHVSPFTGKAYQQIASRVGPPSKLAVAPVDGNLVAGEIVLKQPDAARATKLDHRHLAIGLGDFRRPVRVESLGLLDLLKVGRELNGYLGAWPEPGVLGSWFGFRGDVPPGEVVHVDLLGRLGVFVTKVAEFTILSVNRDDLARVARQVKMIETDQPAQIRLHVGDVSAANMAAVISSLGYQQAHTRSVANARFMHHLADQFQAPREDCRELAEGLVGARLVCPLGGEYQLTPAPGSRSWISTAWQDAATQRDAYISPPLRWFRGLNARATLHPDRLTLHAQLLMHRRSATGFQLPELEKKNPPAAK